MARICHQSLMVGGSISVCLLLTHFYDFFFCCITATWLVPVDITSTFFLHEYSSNRASGNSWEQIFLNILWIIKLSTKFRWLTVISKNASYRCFITVPGDIRGCPLYYKLSQYSLILGLPKNNFSLCNEEENKHW